MQRRQLIWGGTALAALMASRALAEIPAMSPIVADGVRPPLAVRKFKSAAVEAVIKTTTKRLKDPDLAKLFTNCYPNTLDTTVETGVIDGKPDSFVITGDIKAMWLRDSSAQVSPYLPLAANDKNLRTLFHGLIQRQARCILIDPYANAYMHDPKAMTDLSWSQTDQTDMKPGVAERKWEIDSLCYPIRLAHSYLTVTKDTTPFDDTWRAAMHTILKTFRDQQRKDGDGPYRFNRTASEPTETLARGYGWPTRVTGMIHSGFRPSDDACTYPYFIPGNAFAVVSLRQLAEISETTGLGTDVKAGCLALASEIEAAMHAHGKMKDAQGNDIWAYEVDGYGNALFMDDANVPSLLSLPYIGFCAKDDPLYLRTRAAVLSDRNPYYYKGKVLRGVGSPHSGLNTVWPISLMMQALTSTDDSEIKACLSELKTGAAPRGFMNESVGKDDAAIFTRSWFAWANSLYGELILTLLAQKPALIS
ncbi:glycoside hydrolase family 125 protein [Asticcacaulis sp. 201]|uniref:glycoside hydrolase family 125 protein n=1 Tax=Asticcacaulis sp. 201 TaxID=3028787 RepID=UPI002916AD3D|nr:glycoside hydrolase family 125 protein [Asticcacaulis sp. 201]MDV6331283.1 glycoside hydrolase family 125 protein [Asticcacaulis sp. 201]